MMPMTTTDYLIDSLLVLLVLLQIKERTLTTRTLVRPLVILGVAVANYLHGIPTTGNDGLLIAVIALVGATVGVASGLTAIMRVREDGAVTARAGWASASLWVVGMGSRFAFVYWITHSGAATIGRFSAAHSISSGEAWTVALLAMAVAEVLGRTLVMATRRHRLGHTAAAGRRPVAQLA
jgi:hypothetical protein